MARLNPPRSTPMTRSPHAPIAWLVCAALLTPALASANPREREDDPPKPEAIRSIKDVLRAVPKADRPLFAEEEPDGRKVRKLGRYLDKLLKETPVQLEGRIANKNVSQEDKAAFHYTFISEKHRLSQNPPIAWGWTFTLKRSNGDLFQQHKLRSKIRVQGIIDRIHLKLVSQPDANKKDPRQLLLWLHITEPEAKEKQ